MITLATARAAVRRRLNDASEAFWSETEIDGHLTHGYRILARTTRVIWDQVYLENLPRGCSYTNTFEQAYTFFDYGVANVTYEQERRLIDPEYAAMGPANHTSPHEIPHLVTIGANVTSAPTMQVPTDLTEIDRPVYDNRAVPAISQQDAAGHDSRYEYTEGPIYALVTRGEGVRTVRKVRIPSALADFVTVDGAWGGLRDPADLTTDACTTTEWPSAFTLTAAWMRDFFVPDGGWASHTMDDEADWVADSHAAANHTAPWEYTSGYLGRAGATLTWPRTFGVARQIPWHHPMGPEHFGLPRRVYLDRMNLRVEHWREGQAVAVSQDVFELPDRSVAYLIDYAMSECYRREGPAQDSRLAAHYESRWQRGVNRLLRRVVAMQRNRTGVMGVGAGAPVRRGPPRPSLPWAYGARVDR